MYRYIYIYIYYSYIDITINVTIHINYKDLSIYLSIYISIYMYIYIYISAKPGDASGRRNFTRLAETRLARNTLEYINIAQIILN